MAKWARIENNTTMEITDIDPKDRFHPDLIWEECAEDTQQHYRKVSPKVFSRQVQEENNPVK